MNDETINQIKVLISKGKTKEAIELLLDTSHLSEQALLISSRFEELERKYMFNLISTEDKNIERTRIELSILSLLQTREEQTRRESTVRKKTLWPLKAGLIQIALVLASIGAIGYMFMSHTSSLSFVNAASQITADTSQQERVAITDSSDLKLRIEFIDDFDSTALFYTVDEIAELAAKDFLSQEYTPSDKFSFLIKSKKFDIALQALNIAEQRQPSRKESILARRKSIYLMKKDSFDNVWFDFPGDLILTEKNNKEGLYSRDGIELFEPQFDEIDPLQFEFLYRTKRDGKYGLIDYSGEELFKPYFDDMYTVNPDGLIGIVKGDKYGIVSKEGIELYPPIFTEIKLEEFSMSIIKVKRNGKYGYLNSHGEMLLKTEITYVEQVWAETIFIKIGQKWGVIDLEGQYKLDVEYDKLSYNVDFNIIAADKNGKRYYFNDEGEPTENPFEK